MNWSAIELVVMVSKLSTPQRKFVMLWLSLRYWPVRASVTLMMAPFSGMLKTIDTVEVWTTISSPTTEIPCSDGRAED